ncbi:MAG: hypothetical protein E7014_06415 [Alphaproteobacteria bacterium]|nr:hypothetical protein [Alphaproteobacteria bacterium]
MQLYNCEEKIMQIRVNETGRSMVEILGVLAVIGVLSVGGIMGYRFAMDKYRANDIINEVNMRNRDTWHQYQNKDLPDVETLDEWSSFTQTGFPIGVYPRSHIVFDVQVDNVPSTVCLQVLNMNIEGPLFIWTSDSEGKRVLYNGKNGIDLCGSYTETSLVFTTALDSYGNEEGFRNGLTDDNGHPIRFCLDDSDCREKCETCGLNYTCESNCPTDKPICSANEYKTCVACESNSDCPKQNQICDKSTSENKCISVPEKCDNGYFRSKNGACIECEYGGNIVVSEEAFSMLNVQDDKTGIEMCQACETAGTKRILENITHEDGNKTYYCSATCTKGISVQTYSSGCVSCTDFPLYQDYRIINDSQVQEQCTACGFLTHLFGGYALYCGHQKCPDNKYKMNYNGNCVDCSTWISDGSVVSVEECLTNCHGLRKIDSKNTCARVCPQPTDVSEEESIRICKTEGPSSSNCKRTFVGNYGAAYSCYSCNATTSYSLSNVPEEDKELCEKCGRWYNNGYCHLNGPQTCINKKDESGKNSTENQFRGYDGKCYACSSSSAIEIDTTEDAMQMCVNNCADVQGKVGSVSFVGREILTHGDGKRKFCVPITPNGYFYGGVWPESTADSFIPCNDTSSNRTDLILSGWNNNDMTTICKKCTEREIFWTYHTGNVSNCIIRTCPTRHIRGVRGECISCDDSNNTITLMSSDSKYQLECSACGNRFAVGKQCMKYTPGINGVCNSYDNGTLPPYPAGDGKLLRDSAGNCQDCRDKTARYTMNATDKISQCGSCGDRRLVGNECVHGLCEQESTFITINNTCASCTADMIEIPDTTASRDGCTACNRPLMTVSISEAETKLYCLKEECSNGISYHTQNDLLCKTCSEGGIGIIGNEPVYSAYCEACNRVAYIENGIKKCSQQATDGYFIALNGQKVSCGADKTEIYDAYQAKKLCEECSTTERIVVTDSNGRFYCEKI